MRKLLLSIALIAGGITAGAQGLKVGLGGGVNSTWLLNKNVSDQGDAIDFASTMGGAFGLKAQYFFNDKMGVEMDILYSGHNQKYKISDGDFESKTKLSYIDIPVLFRYGGGQGFYFEVGPQISILSGAKEDRDFGIFNTDGRNVEHSFNNTNFGLVLGLGADIPVADFLTITAGVRFGYGFSDVTKEYSESLLNETMSVSGLGAHYNADDEFDYKPTKRVFGGIHVGVLYNLPF